MCVCVCVCGYEIEDALFFSIQSHIGTTWRRFESPCCTHLLEEDFFYFFIITSNLSVLFRFNPFAVNKFVGEILHHWVVQAELLTPMTFPLGCFYFRCVLFSQWKAVTVNFLILHCQL